MVSIAALASATISLADFAIEPTSWMMTSGSGCLTVDTFSNLSARRGENHMAAYLLAQLTVHDPEGFQLYRDKVPALIAQHGGRYLVRGGEITPLEEDPPASRLVIIEFPDREAAKAFYHAPDYQEILPLRLNAASGPALIVDGI
jgi:uncharacterized protein (DUF1330 family)